MTDPTPSTQSASSKPKWLVIAPFIFLGLWAGGYPVAKVGLQYTDPMTMLSLRYGLVVVIMAVLFVVLKPPLPKRKADWVHLAIVGFLFQAVYFGFCYLGFHLGAAAGTTALLMSLQPILVGLAAPYWTKQTIGWRRWSGLALGMVGTVIVVLARSVIEPPSALAFMFLALALMGITAATLWEKRFGLSHHPVTANLIGYMAGLVGVVPLMLLLEPVQIEWSMPFFWSMLYLVIGNSVIAVGLLLAMIRAGDVSSVSALFFLIPPLAAFLAWWILGEIMPPLAWVGMVIAAIGVYIATRKKYLQ